jgi:serine phosphatase RsbU (regulator of sigma subunit)
LNEIHRALATPISLSALLDLILERCFDVLTPEEGLIMLREKNGELRPAATRRRSESADEFFISRSIIDEVAGKGTPTLVLDATLDARFATSESIMSSGVKSVVAAPLTDADGTIGLIALSSRACVRQFTPPDLELLVSLASAAVLRVRNVALAEEAVERRVLDHELELAHDIQMSMLPRRLPERKEVEVAAWLQPARSVGGDLYDFVLDGDDLWFIVADVADKGVAAALYMAVAKTLFRAMVQARLEPAEVLGRMNRELCRDNDHMVFVTAVAGHLSLSTGEVVLSDSGHNPVLLLRPDRSLTRVALSKGVALGVVEDFAFTQQRMRLAAKDLLVLYTDGATDALNPIGDRFGTGRLERAIHTLGGKPVAVFVPALVGTVNAFAGGAPPEDDLTVLALRYRG